ncbi:glycosyltransferase family 9 protein [Piscinibacter sakaiensis]|uniref:glycosyltransferase family 9 protein n=1 Tax=Piscinibacter sakaiensis TaxID=1547922 RepID=UPI003AABA219
MAAASAIVRLNRPQPAAGPQLGELKNLAFGLNHEHAFHMWLSLDETTRDEALLDKYILASICHSSGAHIAQLQTVDKAVAAEFAQAMTHRLQALAELLPSLKIGFSQTWHEGLDALSGAMLEVHLIAQAEALTALARTTGCDKFPGISQSIALTEAYLCLLTGKMEAAEATALRFVRRPFLMPSRLDRARLYKKILPILIKTGHVKEYKEVLWRGLTGWYGAPALRNEFVDKAIAAYRGPLRALFRSGIPFNGRLIFMISLLTRRTGRSPLLRAVGVHRMLDKMLQTQLYIQNYMSGRRPYVAREHRGFHPAALFGPKRQRKILVTRAMGGMGDVLMMVPGLLALKRKWPAAEIHFAIQKGFFPLFDGISEFKCLDIHADDIDIRDYSRWYDLTDCPAARIEGREFPHVRSNRIAIFAGAMGIKLRKLKKSGIVPRYHVSADEARAADELLQRLNPLGLPVFGIQPYSADTYKNWPHTEALAQDLARDAVVLVFHNEPFAGYEGDNIHKIIKPIRQSAALAARCATLIAPDSSFVHLGAALGVPTVGIFGPTNGYVFGRHYQQVFKIAAPARADFACSPCWRNENRLCAVADDRESVCLRQISVEQVKAVIERPMPSRWERIKDEIRDHFWR